MGYDCSLHLVDERSVRDELIPAIIVDLPVEQLSDSEKKLHELADIPYGVYAVATAPISITPIQRRQ